MNPDELRAATHFVEALENVMVVESISLTEKIWVKHNVTDTWFTVEQVLDGNPEEPKAWHLEVKTTQ